MNIEIYHVNVSGDSVLLRCQSSFPRQLSSDFIYMWNLENRINKQSKLKQVHGCRKYFNGCQMGDWEDG